MSVSFEFTEGSGEAIVRVRHGEVESARAAVACVDEVDGVPVGVCVRGVSGTIRGATAMIPADRRRTHADVTE